MHSIRVKITTPRPKSAQSSLTPSAFLLSSDMIEALYSKNLAITQDEQNALTLDPQPISTDHSIGTYHQRVSELLPNDREELAVLIPMNKIMRRIRVNNHFTSHSSVSLFTNN